jgi:hypothetical protein
VKFFMFVFPLVALSRPGRRAFSCGGGAPGDFCRRRRRHENVAGGGVGVGGVNQKLTVSNSYKQQV